MQKHKIRICFIITNLNQGGAEKQFYNLISGINKNIFEVHFVLYAKQNESFYDLKKLDGVIIHENKLKSKFYLFKIIGALNFIKKTISHYDYNILVSTLFMNNLFTRLVAPSRYDDKIFTLMRTSIQNYPFYYIFFEKFLIKNSYIIFNSNNSLSEFKKVFSRSIHNRFFMIYNGYDLSNNVRNITSKIHNSISVGGLGRISKEKNFVQLVRVFKKYEQKHKLLIKGHFSNQYNLLKKISSDDERISIELPSIDIDSFFSRINILVIPSHHEGCPNVLFESMLRKTICIISKNSNSDKFVINGYNGLEYDGSDENLYLVLRTAIDMIGTKKEIEIINNAHTYVIKNFSNESMVLKYEKIFQNN